MEKIASHRTPDASGVVDEARGDAELAGKDLKRLLVGLAQAVLPPGESGLRDARLGRQFLLSQPAGSASCGKHLAEIRHLSCVPSRLVVS